VNGDAPSKARPAALVFIFITLVLDMLALGMIVPVLPRLVQDFVHGDTARAAYIVGVFGAIAALMQFVFSPVLGAFPITTDAVRWCCFRTSG
jgi:DHA1 family tetracycline resistance protein-like MFS transporter